MHFRKFGEDRAKLKKTGKNEGKKKAKESTHRKATQKEKPQGQEENIREIKEHKEKDRGRKRPSVRTLSIGFSTFLIILKQTYRSVNVKIKAQAPVRTLSIHFFTF